MMPQPASHVNVEKYLVKVWFEKAFNQDATQKSFGAKSEKTADNRTVPALQYQPNKGNYFKGYEG